ncbi:hypothetical protein ABW21_db0201512 [Orbilia brochopaga]|nr:hypothetical protein ABW21_db0201512 [Drechslerella brochopaga]
MKPISSQTLFILLIGASITTADTCNSTSSSDLESLPKATPKDILRLSSDLTERFSSRDDATIEPYIFLLQQEARWDENIQEMLVDDLNGFAPRSRSNFALRSEHLGIYFYIRNTTTKAARSFMTRQQEHISAATRYFSLVHGRRNHDSPLPTADRPDGADLSNQAESVVSHLEPINAVPLNKAFKQSLLSHNDRPPELNIKSRATYGRRTTPTRAGYGAYVYVLDTGFDLEHEAFRRSRASRQITRPIYTGPKPARGRIANRNWQNDQGTGILGIIVGDKTGVARNADILVNAFSLSDEEAREGKPLLLAALVELYDAILSNHEPEDSVIVNISPQRYGSSKAQLSRSETILDLWLEEIMRLFGRLENVVIVTAADNHKEGVAWLPSIDQLPNQLLIGGIDKTGGKMSFGENIWAYSLAQDVRVPAGGTKWKYQRRNSTALAAAAVSGILADYLSRHQELSVHEAKNRLQEATHLRHGSINGVPILWSYFTREHCHSKPRPDEFINAVTLVGHHLSSKANLQHILSPQSHDVASRTLSAYTLPTAFLDKRDPLPVPGYVTSTQVVLQIDLRPYPGRKTTTTKDTITTVPTTATDTMTRTRVTVLPVREMFTSVKRAVATTVIGVPISETQYEFTNRTCWPLARGAYLTRTNMMNYVENTFCKDLQKSGTPGRCTNVQRDRDTGVPGPSCQLVQTAYSDTLAQMEIGVTWGPDGTPPAYDTCIRVFREQLIDGCYTGIVGNRLNFKAGGSVWHHGQALNQLERAIAKYWIEPQRNHKMMRKPRPVQERYVICSSRRTNLFFSMRRDCYGWGFSEHDRKLQALWDQLSHEHKCAPQQDKWSDQKKNGIRGAEWNVIPTQKFEIQFSFQTGRSQEKCIIDSFRGAYGAETKVTLLDPGKSVTNETISEDFKGEWPQVLVDW